MRKNGPSTEEGNGSARKGTLRYYSLLVFLTAPFLYFFYFTREDFLIRLAHLGMIFLFAFFFENFGFFLRLIKKTTHLLPVKKVPYFFLFLMLSGILTSLFVRSFPHFGGDEPHYVIMTQSLVEDGDLNLKNNYQGFTYKNIHPLPLNRHSFAPEKAPAWYPFHSIGLSIILIPPYLIKKYIFAGSSYFTTTLIFRIYLSIFVLLFMVFLRDYLTKTLNISRLRAHLYLFLFYFTTPLFFFSIHLYPEIIAFLLSFTAFILLEREKPPILLASGLIAVLLLFHSKFLIIQMGFVLYFILRQKGGIRKTITFMTPQLVGFMLHFLYLKTMYHTFSPTHVYENMHFGQWFKIILSIPLIKRLESFFGYFLDQRDGLVFYFLLLILLFLFLKYLIKDKQLVKLFLSIFLLYIGYYAFLTARGAYCPPARPVLPVLWIILILLLKSNPYLNRDDKRIIYSLSFISAYILIILIFNPLFLYQPTTTAFKTRAGALFSYLGNLYVDIPSCLPSFLKINNLSYWPNYIWIILLAFLALLYHYNKKIVSRIIFAALLSFLLISRVLFPYPQADRPQLLGKLKPITFYNLSGDLRKLSQGDGLFIVQNRSSGFKLFFSSVQPLKHLRLRLGNTRGQYTALARLFDRVIFEGDISQRDIEVDSPEYYYKGEKYYYWVTLDFTSRQNLQEVPFVIRFR